MVSRSGLPLSQVSAVAIASRFCSIRSAIFSRMLDRSVAEVRPQASRTLWAASRAASISLASERGTSQTTLPVTGEMFCM